MQTFTMYVSIPDKSHWGVLSTFHGCVNYSVW